MSTAGAVDELYRVFARYPRPERVSPCTFCWDQREIEALRASRLRAIDPELVRSLLWETADHWESVDAYRHYLPRLLEAMTPAVGVEDMYPVHLFETLSWLGFAGWPADEKEAVLRFLAALEAALPSVPGLESESDQAAWRNAAEALRLSAG
jgi:hypothetical protein